MFQDLDENDDQDILKMTIVPLILGVEWIFSVLSIKSFFLISQLLNQNSNHLHRFKATFQLKYYFYPL